MKINRRTSYSSTFNLADGREVEVEFPYSPSSIMEYKEFPTCEKNGKLIVGFLADDCDCANPLEDCDGMGHIYSSHRNSGQHREMQKALGLDSYWTSNTEIIEECDVLNEFYAALDNDPDMFRDVLAWCHENYHREHFDADLSELDFIKQCIDTEGSISEAVYSNYPEELREILWQRGRENGTIGNPYAISLDVYEHGGISYSVTGTGMQCAFDTARGGAVWIPDDCALENMEVHALKKLGFGIETIEVACVSANLEHQRDWKLRINGQEFTDWGLATRYAKTLVDPQLLRDAVRTEAYEFAASACDQYTKWCNGDCYGYCVVEVDPETNETNELDACWGFIGSDYAMEELERQVKYYGEKDADHN